MLTKTYISWLFFLATTMVNGVFAMQGLSDLSKSVIASGKDGISEIYNDAKGMASNDATRPLIAHITEQNKSAMWKSLITLGFNKNDFSPQDIMWVINEYSNQTEKSKDLFQCMIIDTLKGEQNRAKSLGEVMKKITIPKAYSCLDLGSSSHSEKYNVMTAMIENNQMVAFKEIIEALTTINKLSLLISSQRFEYVGQEEGLWGKYKYQEKNYSLVNWLMRDKNTYSHAYLDKKIYARLNYIEAAQIIISKILSKQPSNIKNIDGGLFGMIALLDQQNDLPKNTSLEKALSQLINFSGINIKPIPGEQRGKILNLLTNYPELKKEWEDELKKQSGV